MAVLGLDLGASKLALALDRDGQATHAHLALPDRGDGAAELAELSDAIHATLTRLQPPAVRLRAAVLAAAPILAPDGTIASWPSRPHWTGLDLRGAIQTAVGLTAIDILDDGDAAAIAEAEGATGSVLFLGMGSGIGGGIVRDGEVWRLPGNASPEIGHVPVAPGGPPCGCGRAGCLQSLASARALAAAFEPGSSDNVAAILARLRAAVDQGSPGAVEIVSQAAHHVATGILVAAELFGIDEAVIGGGAGILLPELTRWADDSIGRRTRAGARRPRLRLARHGAQASLRGALLLARRQDEGTP